MDPKEKEELNNSQVEADQENVCDTEDLSEEVQEEVENQEEDLNCKIAELQDKYLRLAAEFDNYRKRTMKEKADIIKTAGERVISNILPVLDDMERAIKTMSSSEDVSAVKEGVDLIYCKFVNTLSQDGLQKIATDNNENFNTDYHEAVALVPAPSEDLKGKILDTVQNGYTLNDKVIRHAKVVVGE